ncbi:MAG TPA: RIP metalloprotease RseP, partial [Chthoniobacterales bacterium]
MEIFKILFILLEVVLLFNLIIVVHELGHFLAARWRGLKVDKFAVWFGKPLWKKTIGGVEYRLGSIPAGGFVSIPQLAPMEAVEGKPDQEASELPLAKPIDKIIVAAAGPIFSLGLAVAFALIVWVIGRPVSEGETSTTIGYVLAGGPADKAGLRAGDRILSVNGNPVSRFSGMGNVEASIVWNIARSEEPSLPIEIERDGKTQTVWVEPSLPTRQGWSRKNLRQIAIAPAQTPMIAKVIPGSPAAAAELRPQDLILAINGQKLLSLPGLAEYLNQYSGGPVTLTVSRDGQTFEQPVTPQIPVDGDKPRIGIQWDDRGLTTLSHPNPIAQIVASAETMWATLTAIASPKSDIKIEHLSGPVGIMRLYYLIFEAPDGWRVALWFSVIFNVNLAILNLLPLPVLDGGHITLSLIELIRRRPLDIRL